MGNPISTFPSFQAMQGGISRKEEKGLYHLIDAININFNEQLAAAQYLEEKISFIPMQQTQHAPDKKRGGEFENGENPYGLTFFDRVDHSQKFEKKQSVDRKEQQQQIQTKKVERAPVQHSKEQHSSTHPSEGKEASKESPNSHPVNREPLSNLMNAEQRASLLREFNQLAQNVHVQQPNVAKLSQKIIEALKAVNSKMITFGKSQNSHPVVNQGSLGTATQGKDNEFFTTKEPLQHKTTYEDPRMEHMKQRILEQVRFQMRLIQNGKSGEALLRLKPAFLGNVTIKMRLHENQVLAHFYVENQTVKEVLQKEISTLHKSLQDKGIEVNGVEVSVVEDSTSEGEHSRAFNSYEEQESVKKWLNSFVRIESDEQESIDSNEEELDPNQLINIVV